MRDHENARANGTARDRLPSRKPERARPGQPGGLLGLQAAAGNAAALQMLRQAGHPWALPEQHRHSADCGHRTEPPAVQRSAVHDVLRTGGRPLDEATRGEMEARLGADFSQVRIHTDAAARASAAQVGARAYTSGNHVVIGAGGADKHTLAHELTHVIQQRRGPVAGTDNGAGLRVSDPSDRFEREAEANARRVMSAAIPSPQGASRDAAGRSAGEPAPAAVPGPVRIRPAQRAADRPAGSASPADQPIQRLSDYSDYSDSEEDSVYPAGTYGARSRARSRLAARFNAPMSGATHQEEHAVAYGATARYAPARRSQNVRHEGLIPSYQETYAAHRRHVGTGSSTRRRATGLSSVSYRDAQEGYIRRDDSHSALLLNQVEYNEVPEFHRASGTIAGRQSDLSYRHTLRSNQPIPYYDSDGEQRQTSRLRPWQQADLLNVRETMRRRRYPDEDRARQLLQHYGATRPDDYPTRSRRPRLESELTSFPDLRDRSSSPLRIPPGERRGRALPASSQRQLLEQLARTGISSRSRSTARYDVRDSDSDSDVPLSSQQSRSRRSGSRAPRYRYLDDDF